MGDEYDVMFAKKKFFEGLALSREAIGDAPLWCERRLNNPDIYFSEALQQEIKQAGLKLPSHHRRKEV